MLPLLERLRFLKQSAVAWPSNHRIKVENPGRIFPPLWVFYDAYSHCRYDHYLSGGKLLAEYIVRIICERKGKDRVLSVLDWGCGPARVIQWVGVSQPEWKLNGCDYNAVSIDWCNSALPSISFRKNKLTPPLPYDSESIDVVYCWSVFTHLSEEQFDAWMLEISRVLKPGGIFIFSTQSEEATGKLLEGEKATFEKCGIVVRDKVVEGSRMYAAFHSSVFVKERCIGHFSGLERLGKVPGRTWEQCIWVASK